jgi:hypothetical protein
MLNQQLFMQAMEQFMAYYGKSLIENKLAYQAWYKYLSKHLTDEDFVRALEIAIEKFEFMPSPEKLVEAVKGSQEALAYEEWNLCTHAVKIGSAENLLLSAQAEKALSCVGGFHYLTTIETQKLHGQTAKDFVRLWVQYKSAIASGAVSAPSAKLKAVPDLPKQEEPPATPEQWKEAKSKIGKLFTGRKKA